MLFWLGAPSVNRCRSLSPCSLSPFCAVIKLPFFQPFNIFIIYFLYWTSRLIGQVFLLPSACLSSSTSSVDRLKLSQWIESIYFLVLIQWSNAVVASCGCLSDWMKRKTSIKTHQWTIFSHAHRFFLLSSAAFIWAAITFFWLLFIPFGIFLRWQKNKNWTKWKKQTCKWKPGLYGPHLIVDGGH